MALTKDSTGYYLEPSTGQYYEVAPQPVMNFGGKGMSPMANMYNNGMYGMNRTAPQEDTIKYLTEGGVRYKPFTGNAPGISAGIRSMADQLTQSLANYQAPQVPTLAQLFPSMNMQAPTAPMQNTMSSGAGRFLSSSNGMNAAPSIPFNFNAPTT